MLTNEEISQIDIVKKLATIRDENGGTLDLPTSSPKYMYVARYRAMLKNFINGKVDKDLPKWMQRPEVVDYLRNVLGLIVKCKNGGYDYDSRTKEQLEESKKQSNKESARRNRERMRSNKTDAARAVSNIIDSANANNATTMKDYINNSIASLEVGKDDEGNSILETDANNLKEKDYSLYMHVSALSPDEMQKTDGKLYLLPHDSLNESSRAVANRPNYSHPKTDNETDHTHFVWATSNASSGVAWWIGHDHNQRQIKQMIRDGKISIIENADGSVHYFITVYLYFIFPTNRENHFWRFRQLYYNGNQIAHNHELLSQAKGRVLPCAAVKSDYNFYSSTGKTAISHTRLFEHMQHNA